MKVDFFLIADRAQTDPETGKLTVEGVGITHVNVEGLPVTLPMMVAVARLLIEDRDTSAPISMRIRWVNPEGGTVEAEPLVVSPEHVRSKALGHEGEERATFYIVNMPNITFRTAGPYRLQLLLNDRKVRERTLIVVHETPGELEAPSDT